MRGNQSVIAGFVVGAMLMLSLPVVAANGDSVLLGQGNSATKITKIRAGHGKGTVQLKNTGTGPALDLRVGAGVAPMKVNSSVKVRNLNAEYLGGLDVDALKVIAFGTRGTINGNGGDPFFAVQSPTLTVPGGILLSGSVELDRSTVVGVDQVRCYFTMDGSMIQGSLRIVLLANDIATDHEDYEANCSSDTWIKMNPTSATQYDFQFVVDQVDSATRVWTYGWWGLFVPE